jgi:hypothetical protein
MVVNWSSRDMTPTVAHVAAVVAGLAIVATSLTVAPRTTSNGLLKGTALAVALAVTAALLITAVRAFG